MSEHKQFMVSQQVVLQNDEGKVLILQRAGNGFWLLPGGRIEESDENLEEALAREVFEEIKVRVTVGKPIAVDTATHWHTFAVAFLATTEGPVTPVLDEEHTGYEWVTPEEASTRLYYKRIGKAIQEQLG